MPHTDVFWYFLNGMGALKYGPQKVFPTFFSCIFYVKTK